MGWELLGRRCGDLALSALMRGLWFPTKPSVRKKNPAPFTARLAVNRRMATTRAQAAAAKSLLARSDDELRIVIESALNVFTPQHAGRLGLACRRLRGLLREPLAELKALRAKGVALAAKLKIWNGSSWASMAFAALPTADRFYPHPKLTADEWTTLTQLGKKAPLRIEARLRTGGLL